ncbi:MAG: CusA/CzcA family heavy metal efflux RND transporter, partial [Flavobacteriales bacterium]|nr:CusA/CzcA family heavy metal efflux RND transporter [Flavobacteriales bacterium]
LIVILVLVLFLGQLRAGLIVASVIPLSMLFALILMDLFGVTGNLMSLGAIDFGLIVDGAVIIVEAVLHRLQGIPTSDHRLTRERMDQEVTGAAGRMMSAAAFGQLIILIVYIPILTLRGIEGKMFGPMAQTVSFAILGAILLSLTYVPVMSALFIKRRTGPSTTFSDRMMAMIERRYRPVLEYALKRKVPVVAAALGLLGISLVGFMRMGGEFIPQLEEGDFAFHSILPPGASLSASVHNNTLVERKLLAFPEVRMVVGKSGTAEVPTDLMSPEQTDVMIMLKEKNTWITASNYWDLADTLINALKTIPGVFFEINQPIQMRFNELMTGVRQDVAIKVYGPDLDTLVHYADRIAGLVQNIPGAGTPQVEQVDGLPQIAVRYDRERLAGLGYDVAGLNRTVRTAFAGEPAGAIYENERRFDLVVRADSAFRTDIRDVASLYVGNERGDKVPLGQLADVRFEAAPAQITHENAQRRIYVGVNARGRDVESLVGEIEDRVNSELLLPPGYHITYGGQFQNLVEAKQRLSLVVPMALILILGLLYFTFRSLPHALLIFTAVPLSAIGGVAALYLRDMPFSISAGVGFIALFGVAVLNGLVLISTFKQLAADGEKDVLERIRIGTRMRLRPVLMTACVASLGFLPMALSNGSGAEVQRPLATVVIGGLISATLLTLVVLPALYAMFFERRTSVKAALPLALFALLSVGSASAQELRVLTLDSAITIAHRSSPTMLAARASEASAQQLRRTGFELPNTEFQYMQGQFNSYVRDDNNITIQQRLPFPTAVAARSGLVKAEAESATAQRRVSEADLIYEVAVLYHRIQFLHANEALVQLEDSTFSELARVAELRHGTGEGTLLQRTTAAVRSGEVRDKHRRLLAEIIVAQERLAARLGLNTMVDVVHEEMRPLPVPELLGDPIRASPDLRGLDHDVEVAHQRKRVESNALLPDLMVGYFNQSLIGGPTSLDMAPLAVRSDRFEGFLAGVSVPLWFLPQAARSKAAGYQEEVARYTLEAAQLRFRAEVDEARTRLEQEKATLLRYTTDALPNAERILHTSNAAFAAGEIGQAEHVLNVLQAMEIRQAYLRVVHDHNTNVLRLQRLISAQ